MLLNTYHIWNWYWNKFDLTKLGMQGEECINKFEYSMSSIWFQILTVLSLQLLYFDNWELTLIWNSTCKINCILNERTFWRSSSLRFNRKCSFLLIPAGYSHHAKRFIFCSRHGLTFWISFSQFHILEHFILHRNIETSFP